jgi:hypothetical protein
MAKRFYTVSNGIVEGLQRLVNERLHEAFFASGLQRQQVCAVVFGIFPEQRVATISYKSFFVSLSICGGPDGKRPVMIGVKSRSRYL